MRVSMKGAIVAGTLSTAIAYAVIARATDPVVDNPPEITLMCKYYSATVGYSVTMRELGADYETVRQRSEKTINGGLDGLTISARDRAFIFRYASSGVEHGYALPKGTNAQYASDAALAHCQGEFGQ